MPPGLNVMKKPLLQEGRGQRGRVDVGDDSATAVQMNDFFGRSPVIWCRTGFFCDLVKMQGL